ncbi:hypothetical protein pb186bvf_007269 [Paramecium bursaria]
MISEYDLHQLLDMESKIQDGQITIPLLTRITQMYAKCVEHYNNIQDPAQYYFHQKMQGLLVRQETLKALCSKEAEIPKIIEPEQNPQVIDKAAIQRKIGIIGTINQNIQSSNQEEVVQSLFEQVEQQQQKVEQELKYQGTNFQTRLEQRKLTRQSTQRVAKSNVNSRQKLETYSNNTSTPVSLISLDDPKLNSDDVKKSETASQPETSQFADQNLSDIPLPNGLDEIKEDHRDEAQQSMDIHVEQDPHEIKQDEYKEDEQKEQINKEEQIIKIDAYENPIQDKDIEEAITE